MIYHDLLKAVHNPNTWASDIVGYTKTFSNNPYIRAFDIWKMFGVYINHYQRQNVNLDGVSAEAFIKKLSADELDLGYDPKSYSYHITSTVLRHMQLISPVIVFKGFWNSWNNLYENPATTQDMVVRTSVIIRMHDMLRNDDLFEICTSADITVMQQTVSEMYSLLFGEPTDCPVYKTCMSVLKDYMNITACTLNARIICESL